LGQGLEDGDREEPGGKKRNRDRAGEQRELALVIAKQRNVNKVKNRGQKGGETYTSDSEACCQWNI
jgi:hypothetical protein